MRAINVWAWQRELPNVQGFERPPICADGTGAAGRMGPHSMPWLTGQGWHLALSFASLEDLADQLSNLELPAHIHQEPRRLQRGEIQTLAIDCHGSPGRLYPAGVARELAVTARNIGNHRDALRRIGLMTASRPHQATDPLERPPFIRPPADYPASTILLVACNSAAGRLGSQLLVKLSFQWPGRLVVGFSTSVIYPRLSGRATDPVTGDDCVPPFALDSGRRRVEGDWVDEELRQPGMTPERLPYANASAANAKTARDGQILSVPLNERGGSGRQAGLLGPPRGTIARPAYSPQSVRA
jgi:hypothetical protein